MSIYRFVHLIFGEYVFETDSTVFPRFANLLSNKNLNFWGSKYKENKVRFSNSVFTAEAVVQLAKDSHIPLRIVERKGIPFFLAGYKRRYGLMLGAVFGLFLLFYSQLFVWNLEISGNEKLSVLEIEEALEECGVSVGSFIPKIDVGYTRNILLLNCRDISSAAISINGTHIKVSVLERTFLPDIINREGYYNVTALEDGVILDVDAIDGTPEVEAGDVVYKGQLLINSFIESKNGTYRPTHAQGVVYAAVNKRFETEVPLQRVSKSYTGKSENKTRYEILGWEVPELFGAESDYEYFDVVSARKKVVLFGFIKLPIVKYSLAYTEYVTQATPINTEMAEKYANAELKEFLKDFNAEILECQTDFKYDEKNDVCRLSANVVVKLNIANEVEFNLNQSISERLERALE